MLFNSLHFCIFFPLVSLLYFLVPSSYSWLVLLLASYYFYMSWHPTYIVLIIISTIIDYGAALLIAGTPKKLKKRLYLGLSIVSNLGLLFTFKYFNFFNQSAMHLLQWLGFEYQGITLSVLLPVGISFYTFQTMSYTIDVYSERQQPEKHFGKFALFVTFFPQLVAGPIERAGNLLRQFNNKNIFNYDNAIIGLRILLGGTLLKVVVADNIAKYVDAVYNNVHAYTGWPLLFATYLFAFQIFCDFAGYSYMAIGLARILGFTLMENFAQPYLATSIGNFWQRWHISLSTWFRDYVYIPLGGNRVSVPRWLFNLFITFLISGLWHGANWTFVVWGALNGIYLIISYSIPARFVNVVPKMIRIGITFCFVCFAWIFFRANTLSDAWYIVHHLWDGMFDIHSLFLLRRAVVAGRTWDVHYLFLLTLGVWIAQLVQVYIGQIRVVLANVPLILRRAMYYAAISILFLCGEFGGQQFIYFQF